MTLIITVKMYAWKLNFIFYIKRKIVEIILEINTISNILLIQTQNYICIFK